MFFIGLSLCLYFKTEMLARGLRVKDAVVPGCRRLGSECGGPVLRLLDWPTLHLGRDKVKWLMINNIHTLANLAIILKNESS
jgi:hypothetical protein